MPASALQLNTNTNSTNSNGIRSTNMPSIPLLILNSVPQQNQDKDTNQQGANIANDKGNIIRNILILLIIIQYTRFLADISNKLKELIEIQKEKLKVEQKKLSIEKQRLDFERLVGAQLLTLIPMVGELVKQLSPLNSEIVNNGENSQDNKRKHNHNNNDVNTKYLKTIIQDRIKKYIMGDINSDDDSDNEDVDVVNENSENNEQK